MKAILLTLSFFYVIALVNGHGYFSSITVDGLAYKEGDCTRPHPSSEYDYPISQKGRPQGLQSNDMTCGWLPSAAKAANKKCPVQPGSKIVYQFHYEMGMGDRDTYIIAPDHRGPCIIYLAKSETGSGPVWFKIFEDGYDQSTKLWCVDKLRAGKGKLNFTIPADLAPGNYLMRGEIIALHEGFELYGAQPYVGCVEITVGGSKTGVAPASSLVSFPGAYKATDAGINFNIYTSKNPAYPIPGPAVAKLTSSGSSSSSTSTSGSKPTPAPTPAPAPAPTPTPNPTPNPAPTPSSTSTGEASSTGGVLTGKKCSTNGNMRCVTSESYQTCDRKIWQAVQSCNVGTTCSPQGNVIYCV